MKKYLDMRIMLLLNAASMIIKPRTVRHNRDSGYITNVVSH